MSRPYKIDDFPTIFAVADAKNAGITRGQLSRKGFESIATGVKQLKGTEVNLAERIIATARSVPQSIIASVSVAQIAGWRLPSWAQNDTQVYLLTTDQRQIRRDSVKSHRFVIEKSEYIENRDYRITTVERTFLDLGAVLAEEELIIVADGLLCSNKRRGTKGPLADKEKLQNYLAEHCSHPGKRKCLRALARSSTGSDSPQETRLRLILENHGVTGLTANPLILGEFGEYLFEPDLADYEYKISIQYEGEHHSSRTQIRRDNERARRTASAGWVEIKIFAEDLTEFEEYRGEILPRAVKRVLEARSQR